MTVHWTPLINHNLRTSPEKLIGLFLCLGPLFVINIKGWVNLVLFCGAIFSFIFLLFGKKDKPQQSMTLDFKIIIFSLSCPIISAIISSIGRGNFHFSEFDSPSRFLISIPIFLFAVRTNLNTAKILQFIIPISLFIIIGQQYTTSQPTRWGSDRMSTYFADPLVFGYITMTFGLMCLISINALDDDSPFMIALKLSGIALGFYLTIKSGSRTGWLAVPIVFGVFLYQRKKYNNLLTDRNIILLSMFIAIAFYYVSETIHSRVNLLVNEIFNYSRTGIAPDTSVGSRITFIRIAWDLFFQSPWIGFGDTRIVLPTVPLNVHDYASANTISMAFQSGFHNEIITNTIRFGVLGLTSSVLLFLAPLFIFAKNIKSDNKITRASAFVGLSFVVCMLISSFSTEIFNLKYTASFYSLMVALLCGSTLANHRPESVTQR